MFSICHIWLRDVIIDDVARWRQPFVIGGSLQWWTQFFFVSTIIIFGGQYCHRTGPAPEEYRQALWKSLCHYWISVHCVSISPWSFPKSTATINNGVSILDRGTISLSMLRNRTYWFRLRLGPISDHYFHTRFATWSSIFMMHVKAWDQHQYQQLGTRFEVLRLFFLSMH
jgi:hypothetical protein